MSQLRVLNRIRVPQHGFIVVAPGAVIEVEQDGYITRRIMDGDIEPIERSREAAPAAPADPAPGADSGKKGS